MLRLQTILSTLKSGQFWYIFPHHFYRKLRHIQALKTDPIETTPPGKDSDIPELHILTGKSAIGDLIFAVKSFYLNYNGPFSLVIHGDKSVNKKTIRLLEYHFPSAKVISKDERDEFVLPKLRKMDLGNCLQFRQANVFGERLIDTILYAQNRTIINMDTDCLAISKLDTFKKYLESDTASAVYALDPNKEPYCFSISEAEKIFGIAPVPFFNAGFCALPKNILTLDQIEKWLEKDNYPLESHFAEQTVLAAFANMVETKVLPKDKYNVGRTITEDQASFIHYAGHYLSDTRIAMRKIGQFKILKQLKKHRLP